VNEGVGRETNESAKPPANAPRIQQASNSFFDDLAGLLEEMVETIRIGMGVCTSLSSTDFFGVRRVINCLYFVS